MTGGAAWWVRLSVGAGEASGSPVCTGEEGEGTFQFLQAPGRIHPPSDVGQINRSPYHLCPPTSRGSQGGPSLAVAALGCTWLCSGLSSCTHRWEAEQSAWSSPPTPLPQPLQKSSLASCSPRSWEQRRPSQVMGPCPEARELQWLLLVTCGWDEKGHQPGGKVSVPGCLHFKMLCVRVSPRLDGELFTDRELLSHHESVLSSPTGS